MTEEAVTDKQDIFSNDSLGDRCKRYELASGSMDILPGRMPVLIRVDGNKFSSYTRFCHRPFDDKLMAGMDQVALFLCQKIQGAEIAYIQSDEITILVHGYKRLNSQPFCGNRRSKMETLSASMAGAIMTQESIKIFGELRPAWFDSRAFVVPENDVCNQFVWRGQDWHRNSLQMLARSLYSHKELHLKNQTDLHEMIHQKGQNWNDLATRYKRGRCAIKSLEGGWVIDNEIPVFSEDRSYIEKLLVTEE